MRIPPKLLSLYHAASARDAHATPTVHAKHITQPDAACGYTPPTPRGGWFKEGRQSWWIFDHTKDVNCRWCTVILEEKT